MSTGPDNSVPRVSVIIVSDYEPGEKTWADEIAAVNAFLADAPPNREAGAEASPEIIVMETMPANGAAPKVPAAIASLAPRVRVYFEADDRSSALKDAGLKYCRGELIAVVEADCLPQPGWLHRLVAALDADPGIDVVSGRTTYRMHSAMRRVMSLLDRGYMERRVDGRYIHVSNNGALYRRHVLERFPYPDEANPFVSAEMRHNQIHQAGVLMGVETRAEMIHGYGGLPFLIDVRRNKGYQAARMFAALPRYARASALRLAFLAVGREMCEDWATLRAVGKQFLRWTDWPLLMLVFLAVRIPEFAGAFYARNPDRFAATTAYR